MAYYNHMDIERAFMDALTEAGIAPHSSERIIMDGRKHRYRIFGDKKGERTGEYCVYVDESPAGWFKSYRPSYGADYTMWFMDRDNSREYTAEEKASFIEAKRKEREEREKSEKQQRANALQKARMRWDNATDVNPKHGYMVKKKLTHGHGAKQLGHQIVIPYFDIDGDLQTVQTIDSDGSKLFQSGAAKRGNFCVLSVVAQPDLGGYPFSAISNNGIIWLCEGWATGCSIQEATGDSVVVAADAGNLEPVLDSLRRKYSSREIVIAADQDKYKNNGNTGMSEAIRLFEEKGIPIVEPHFSDNDKLTDWNDYAIKHGLKNTKKALYEGLKRIKELPSYQDKHRWPRFVDVTAETNKPKGTIENLEVLLKFLGITINYDEIKKTPVTHIPGRAYNADDAENAMASYIKSVAVKYGLPKGDVLDYLKEIALRQENSINPVKDWILSKPWDGIPRICNVTNSIETEEWFPVLFKQTLIEKWLLSAVAAAIHPGFFSRGVLLLSGKQAIGKTTWLKSLVGGNYDWFGEGKFLDPTNKDSIKENVSVWISELGEVDATFKRSDIARLKSFIQKEKDTLRSPYAASFSFFQRRTVFCGSVNQQDILRDDTGNSRWWCLPVKFIHPLDPSEMQQMWAEVYEDYYLSETVSRRQWWLSKEEESELDNRNKAFETADHVADAMDKGIQWDIIDEDLWEEKTLKEILESCGIDRPSASDYAKAGRVLIKKTKKQPSRRHVGRVYKVPPLVPNYKSVFRY